MVSIAKELSTPPLRFERISGNALCGTEFLHPNKSAVVLAGKDPIAIFGEVHPGILKKCDIHVPVSYIEIEQTMLYDLPERNIKFTQLLKFPSTSFDVSAIVPERTESAQLLSVIKKAVDPKIFIETKLVDKFIGFPILPGFASITMRVVLNAKERTLTIDEMKETQQKVFTALRNAGWKISGD